MQVEQKRKPEQRPSDLRWETVGAEGGGNVARDFRLAQQQNFVRLEAENVWWSAVIELRNASIAGFAKQFKDNDVQQLHVPSDYSEQEQDIVHEAKVIVVFARTELLQLVNANPERFGVSSVRLGAIFDPAFIDFQSKPQKSDLSVITVPNGSVVTAVIDDGIAFGNDVFRDGLTSTRVEYVTILPEPPGVPPSVGIELYKAQIDVLLAANTTAKLLDEDRFYQQAGLIDYSDGTFSPASLRRSHGTHVMGLAAGYPMDEAPDDRPIICAILPTRVTEDVSGGSILPSLILVLQRLTQQAARFRCEDGTRPPAVFNFSYGNFAGPHDGTSPIARVIEDYFGDDTCQQLRMFLPAGNGNLSRTHAKLAFPGTGNRPEKTLDLVLMPDDRTASEVQMWMPYSASSPLRKFVTVRVTTPDGLQSGPVGIAVGSYQALFDAGGHEVARLSFAFEPFPTKRGVITLSLNPTASLTPAPLAPSGRWKIAVKPDEIAPDDSVQVWIERDDTLPGFRRGGRQPYFNNADYQRFNRFGAPLPLDPPGSDCPVQRAGTLSGFACGPSPLVIGALTQSNGRMSDYSAAGPTTPPRDAPDAYRDGPDASARGDDSPVLHGVISAGSRSGSMVRLAGTSVAAPRAARYTVNQMAMGAAGDRDWIWVQAELQDPDFPPPKPEETRTGGGRLDISVNEIGS